MKQYTRIAHALFNQPWLILPSTHREISKIFRARVEGISNGMSPFDDFEDDVQDTIQSLYSDVAIITVDGIIGKHLSMMDKQCAGGVDCDDIALQLKAARDNSAYKSIVMYFNTPGGTVTGVKELGELIAAVNQVKPIYGYTDTLCASAGYWLASQCKAFACSETSKVGSVNVYLLLLDESQALDDAGIKVNAIVGSNGNMKLAGASFKPLTDDEREMFQEQVNQIQSQFFQAVLANRNIDMANLNGAVFDGISAVQLGFADDNIPSLSDFMERLSASLK